MHSSSPFHLLPLTIVMKSGKSYQMQIGKGNNVYPDTAWLQFDVMVYQNPRLAAVLETFTENPLLPVGY